MNTVSKATKLAALDTAAVLAGASIGGVVVNLAGVEHSVCMSVLLVGCVAGIFSMFRLNHVADAIDKSRSDQLPGRGEHQKRDADGELDGEPYDVLLGD